MSKLKVLDANNPVCKVGDKIVYLGNEYEIYDVFRYTATGQNMYSLKTPRWSISLVTESDLIEGMQQGIDATEYDDLLAEQESNYLEGLGV